MYRAKNSNDNNRTQGKYRAESRSKNAQGRRRRRRWFVFASVTYRSFMGEDILKVVEHDVIAVIESDIETQIIDQITFLGIVSLI